MEATAGMEETKVEKVEQVERKKRKVRVGTVVSDKMQKTVVVQIERLVKHPVYKRYVRRRKRFKVHDEKGECRVGDVISFTETRPLSKDKCWRFLKLIERAE
jgi:small subunit ribosomal protein S17